MSKTFITNVLEIVQGRLSDYKKLAEYHYLPESPGPTTEVWKIRAKFPYTNDFPDPIAVTVFKNPIGSLRVRDRVTNGYFTKGLNRSEQLKLINKNISYVCRLIVDPRFHRLGLGSKLMYESIRKQTTPIVESLTPIDFTNSILIKAGFTMYPMPAPIWYHNLVAALESLGVPRNFHNSWNMPELLQKRIENLDDKQTAFIEKKTKAFLQHFRNRHEFETLKEKMAYIVKRIPYPEAYFIWYNPDVPLPKRS